MHTHTHTHLCSLRQWLITSLDTLTDHMALDIGQRVGSSRPVWSGCREGEGDSVMRMEGGKIKKKHQVKKKIQNSL